MKCIITILVFCIMQSQVALSCPENFRRFDETYHYKDYSITVDTFWLGDAHLFIITFNSPPLRKASVKIKFTNRSSRKIITAESSLSRLKTGIYRGVVYVEGTEVYGKGRVQVSGRIIGSDSGSDVIFERDLKPFLPLRSNKCY